MSSSLSTLIARWEEARAQGQDVAASELCRDCPENTERLERIIGALRGTQADAPEPPSPSEQESRPDETLVRAHQRTTSQPFLTPPDYEVHEILGRGGMGIVYKAKQVALDRLVALKVILAGAHASAEERARFQAEAEAVGAIRHPGIVQVYQSGAYQGAPYLAMEFCPGGSLADRLKGTPLPPREAARLVELIAQAVEAAHQRGILHRDLKPANVLLDEKGEPKITDFGLAKRLQRDDVTAAGSVMGTPSYMPPEQARGDKVSPATDVYSLGATLYECLTGLPPFRAATRDETMRQLLDSEPVSVRTLQPKTPRDLETICHKCLSKEPGKRYASAAALGDDLARFLRHEPILARPVSFVERASKWVRRRPTLAALWLAIVALLGCMLGVWTVLTVRLDTQMREAKQQRDVAREEAVKAEWFRELMATELEDPFGNEGGVYRISPALGGQQTFMQALARARYKADMRLEESSEIKAAVLDAIGNAYVTLGQHEDAYQCLTDSRRLRQQLHESNPGDAARRLDYARSLHSLGKFHHERGLLEKQDHQTARDYYGQSLAITQERMNDPAFCVQAIGTRFLLAWLSSEEERFDDAIAGFDEVIRLHHQHVEDVKTFDRHHRRHADRLRVLARVGKAAIPVETAPLMRSLAFLDAMKAYLVAIEEMVQHENDKTFKESYRHFKEGVEALLVSFDPRAGREQKSKSVTKAVESLTITRDRLAAVKRNNQLYYALALFFLGEAYLQRGQAKEAVEQFEASLAVAKQSVGYQHYKVPYLVHEYGSALRRTGQVAKGKTAFDEVLAALAVRYGKKHYVYANALVVSGNFLHDCGQHTEAEARFREALAIYQQTGGPKRRYFVNCVENLSETLRAQNRHDEAAKVREVLRQSR